VRCIAGVEEADAVTTESNEDDLNSMHLAGRSRARTLTRTYSNISATAKETRRIEC